MEFLIQPTVKKLSQAGKSLNLDNAYSITAKKPPIINKQIEKDLFSPENFCVQITKFPAAIRMVNGLELRLA